MSQLLGTEVSAIQSCRYSEVFILGFALIPAVPRKCVRYSEVSAISISAIAGFYCIHLWSFHRTADFCCWNHLHLFEVFPYVYLFRLIHDIQSLIVMLNNLSYIHHFVGIFEKNQHSFHDDNNNELLDTIIFSVCLHISQPGNVFQKITHR